MRDRLSVRLQAPKTKLRCDLAHTELSFLQPGSGCRAASGRLFCGLLFEVAAELKAHRREHLILEVRLAA
jgi:hypothetical protein